MTTGWKLDRGCRDGLLERFPPVYAQVVADHVTLLGGEAGRAAPPPADVRSAAILGRADDGAGVEAYVVAIDDSTGRPDGATFHITWSLEPGRTAKESNAVIAAHGWTAMPAVPIALIAASW